MTITSIARLGVAVCLTCVLATGLVHPRGASAAADYPLDLNSSEIEGAVAYLLDEQGSDGGIAGFAVSAWAVMALAAAEESAAVAELVSYLEDEVDTNSFTEAAEWSRMILAIVAAGEDPEDFGGEDYVAGLMSTFEVEDETGEDYVQIGDDELLNDDCWGILALVAADVNVDSDIIDFLLEFQNSDGGWGIDIYSESDVDVTASAIMALIASGADSGETAIQEALTFLTDVQNSDGGFPEEDGGESNAASDAWAIMAIWAADGDPNGSEWEQSGGNPVDHLLGLQDEDGFFNQTGGDSVNPEWMTCYAIPALLGTQYPVPALESSSGDVTISVSPTSLEFFATEGGDDPLDRSFEVWNSGEGAMAYLVSDDEDWLEVGPSSGSSSGEHDEIAVAIDVTGLAEGNYSASITVECDDAGNSPRTVSVTLHVSEAATETEIAVAPDELAFTAEEGGSDPPDQFFEIWNSGPDSLAWEAEVDEDWLDISSASGSSSGEHDKVTVSIDIDELDADDYEGTITITSDDADNSQTLTVTLEVTGGTTQDEPEISVSPSSLEFSAVEDGDDPDEETFQIWNSGDGRLDWEVTDSSSWMTVSPTSGYSNGEKDDVNVSVDISEMVAGEYTGTITIQDEDDEGNRKNVTVTVTIEEDEAAEETPETFLLAATASPDGAGTITRSVAAGAAGYESGTTVVLTATASPGYAFVGWSGDAGGTVPTASVVMNNHRSVVATFLRFDMSGLTNIRLAYASPDLTGLTVMPYPVESIPSNPPGFHIVSAYVVQPEGSGTFALELSELPTADVAALFQVVNGSWEQIPRTVMSDSMLQVTLPVADTVVAVAYPGSSASGILKTVTDFFGDMDSTAITIVVAIGVLVLGIVAVIVYAVRRDSY